MHTNRYVTIYTYGYKIYCKGLGYRSRNMKRHSQDSIELWNHQLTITVVASTELTHNGPINNSQGRSRGSWDPIFYLWTYGYSRLWKRGNHCLDLCVHCWVHKAATKLLHIDVAGGWEKEKAFRLNTWEMVMAMEVWKTRVWWGESSNLWYLWVTYSEVDVGRHVSPEVWYWVERLSAP